MVVKRAVTVVAAILLLINITACGEKKATRYETEYLQFFDTVTRVVAYTGSKEEFEKQAELIYACLEEYHRLYDIYNDYEGINNIKTINDQAGISPVKVDGRIIDLIEFAREWHDKTGGSVNIAFGAVLELWHEYRTASLENPEKAELPPADKLREASGHTDFRKVLVNKAESTVFLEDPEMSLDVGAIAKGYAAEQVAAIAKKNGFVSGYISIGGNVRTIGGKGDDAEPWIVGIRNPEADAGSPVLHTLELVDAAVDTSGTYERYYIVNGRKYHHIINPDTLFPSGYFISVSIICKDSGMADALTTAVFNMPFEQGLEFIEGLPETEAMWVGVAGEVRYSSRFKDYIKK
jgi:thiamine biosynthesis lipoprotein